MSLQGYHFSKHCFPSTWNTWEDNKVFRNSCRCLIDLQTKLIVVLPGDHLSVVEVERNNLVPDDNEVWNKNQCVNKLREILSKFTESDIARIQFPFFDKPGQSKLRPVVKLYSPKFNQMLVVALYMDTHEQTYLPCHIIELGSNKISPKNSPSGFIDCSKLCSIPLINDCFDPIVRDWNDNKFHPLKLYDPKPIHDEIIQKILTLANESPIIHYNDTTRKFDVGCLIESVIQREVEFCIEIIKYE